MKKITTVLLAGAIAISLAACSGGDSAGNGDGDVAITDSAGSGGGYTIDVAELDATVYPENYPLIASAEFDAAFEGLKAANLAAELEGYQDIVEIFGVDGAHYVNNDLDLGGQLFKYYGWYADNETSVVITFKANGDELIYYAYTGNGVS